MQSITTLVVDEDEVQATVADTFGILSYATSEGAGSFVFENGELVFVPKTVPAAAPPKKSARKGSGLGALLPKITSGVYEVDGALYEIEAGIRGGKRYAWIDKVGGPEDFRTGKAYYDERAAVMRHAAENPA
jgi:hypothetical protein